MGKVIITQQKNKILLTLFDEKRPVLFETASVPGETSCLGNIYLARVGEVVKSINGAFLSVSEKQKVYLPFKESGNCLCANRTLEKGDYPRQGDELVVQLTGEALKTKLPTVSTELSLTGQYCVCSFFGHGITYSKKLTEKKKLAFKEALKAADISGGKAYKFTIRTNAGTLGDAAPLLEEMQAFVKIFEELEETYRHRTVYSCLYRTEAEILRAIQNLPMDSYEEIVTDDEEVFDVLKSCSLQEKENGPVSKALPSGQEMRYRYQNKPIRFYKDEQVSLSKLYSIETHLTEALAKKVWLPCGGYLVIEPTEAMVVIDVNSGKTENKDKKNENYFLKVNLEAATEIARQLRLRNYSGIIMVDFINLKTDEDKKVLMKHLEDCLKKDKIPTRLVDMTALGIVEITRKKTSKPLYDLFVTER